MFVEAAEELVGFFLLRLEYVVYVVVLRCGEFQVPVDQFLVKFYPLVGVHTVGEAHTYVAELLLVAEGGLLAHQSACLGVLLDRKEYLVGVDGLDEIVGYLAAEGLVHNVFLFALGNHYYRHARVEALYL